MLFESGAHAEALARINEWDTVSIPIGVLVRGLKHRLAEAVAFFLKTKDNCECVRHNLCVDYLIPEHCVFQ